MSVICKNVHGWLVDQNEAVQKIYNNVGTCINTKDKTTTENIVQKFCLKKDLFSIHYKFMMDSQFKAFKTQTNQKGYQISESKPVCENITRKCENVPSNFNFSISTQDNCQPSVKKNQETMYNCKNSVVNLLTTEKVNTEETRPISQSQSGNLTNTDVCEVIFLRKTTCTTNISEEVSYDTSELTAAMMNVKTKRKRKRKTPLNQGELDAIAYHDQIKETLYTTYTSLLDIATERGYFVMRSEKTCLLSDNNTKARNAAGIVGPGDKLMEMCHLHKDIMENTSHVLEVHSGDTFNHPTCIVNKFVKYRGSTPTTIQFLEDTYILPSNSSFFLSDFTNISHLISYKDFKPYDLVLLDPPWQNRSVKRKKKYWSLTNEDLLKLPIPALLKHSGIVAVWVTNKLQHISFIKECMFPIWNIKFLTVWYWIKVTTSGEMVYDFNSSHKKPYEVLIFGRNLITTTETTPCKDSCIYQVPENKVIISVPCSIHSVKPPLNDLFKEFLPATSQCLELFARNLWPGWTSWGNEVLKHQHLDFYEEHVT